MADSETTATTVFNSLSSLIPKVSIALTALIAVSLLWTSLQVNARGGDGQFPLRGDEAIMAPKTHGTSNEPVQSELKWKVDRELADRIVNYNRHWAEHAGYWNQESDLIKEIDEKIATKSQEPIQFYDSVTGKLLFTAPIGRSYEDFKKESLVHGWPSFRDSEVNWENVRAVGNGEVVSLTGSHLGHNLPDGKGNRYCINLVSVAGNPTDAPSVNSKASTASASTTETSHREL